MVKLVRRYAMKYITDRILEPSTWAGVAVVAVGLSVVMGESWVMIIGAVAAAGALFLREQEK
tara:strand:+ start:1878 stop:2063 length:186 start_codon:yes stop_codon:yes gene_type:complete